MRQLAISAIVIAALAACSQAPQNTAAEATPSTATDTAPMPAAADTYGASLPTPSASPAPNKPAVRVVKPATVTSVSQSYPMAAAPPPAPKCSNCGEITAIVPIKVAGKASGAGAVAGGVAGIIVGNQIGDGNGQTLAKIAGAVGGAYAGNKIEQRARSVTQYEVTVKLENGDTTKLTLAKEPSLAVGARVRVVDGELVAR